MQVGVVQSTEGLVEHKGEGKVWLSAEAKMSHFSGSRTPVPGSWALMFRLDLTPLAPLTIRPLGLDWNYTTSFPGSSACRQQIMKLLSLHNHLSQSHIVNLFLYVYIYYIFYFSGEIWLIQSVMSVGET